MKAKIINRLRASGGFVSSSGLCSELGISRVAVWKHVRRLQALGYKIASGPKGYRLVFEPDTLFPWQFPGREERIVHLAEASSTMDVAKDAARRGCPAFTVVTADRQSAGRGRLHRVWQSAAGGLYFTVVLRPDIPVLQSVRVTFLASAALARVLRSRYGIEAGLKWPNDILVNGRKLCGLLSEMEAESDRLAFLNIGIGINVNNRVPAVEPPATSMKALLGRSVARREILTGFLDEFEPRMAAGGWESAIAEWKPLSVTLGRPVRIVAGRYEMRGVAVDVDVDGALILQEPGGSTQKIVYGDCFAAG